MFDIHTYIYIYILKIVKSVGNIVGTFSDIFGTCWDFLGICLRNVGNIFGTVGEYVWKQCHLFANLRNMLVPETFFNRYMF